MILHIKALALDFDGTLAHHGVVDDSTWSALERFQTSGKLVLVTGRELSELRQVCPRLKLFDLVVAENGALLFDPQNDRVELLADTPPPSLIHRLRLREVYPLSVGHVIVATLSIHEQTVREVLTELELEWTPIPNKEALMLLPPQINKATGLQRALSEVGIAWSEVAGAGDAENDIVFLSECGHAVAVANALPEVKAIAHSVMSKSAGAGVVEFIEMLENRQNIGADEIS